MAAIALMPALAAGQSTGVLTPGAPAIIEPSGECRAAGKPYACCTGRATGTCEITDLACAAAKNGDCTAAMVPHACCTAADAGTCPANTGQVRWQSSSSTFWRCDGATETWVQMAVGAGGSSLVLDFADDDVDESSALAEIAVTGDTNAIFAEPSADKLLIAVGNAWPTADALAADPAACPASQYGTDTDTTGALICAQPTFSDLAGQLGDAQIADGAVDGGAGGEIADGTVTADDLGADSVGADELDALAVEAELEAVLDLADMQERAHASLTGIGSADHHAKTVDAGELTTGTIPPARVGAAHIDALAEIDPLLCGTSAILEDQGAAWACIPTPAASVPGGATTQIQFNDAGAFGGDSDLTWDKTTNSLGMPGGTSLRHDGSNLLLTTTTGVVRLTTGGVTTLRLNGSNPRVEDIGTFGFDIQAGSGVFLRWTVGGWGPRHSDTDTVYGHCDSGDCLALRTGGTNRVEVRNASVQIMDVRHYGTSATAPVACPGTSPIGSKYFDTSAPGAECTCFSAGWTVVAGGGSCV